MSHFHQSAIRDCFLDDIKYVVPVPSGESASDSKRQENRESLLGCQHVDFYKSCMKGRVVCIPASAAISILAIHADNIQFIVDARRHDVPELGFCGKKVREMLRIFFPDLQRQPCTHHFFAVDLMNDYTLIDGQNIAIDDFHWHPPLFAEARSIRVLSRDQNEAVILSDSWRPLLLEYLLVSRP